MVVHLWIVTEPGFERPCVSTHCPSGDRIDLIRARGGEVYEARIFLPGAPRAVDAGGVVARVVDTP